MLYLIIILSQAWQRKDHDFHIPDIVGEYIDFSDIQYLSEWKLQRMMTKI